jgi:predicted RND superfamily exporter protein
VLTSGTTLLALLSLFFLGGEVIRPFAFAMIVGIFVGTYSSIYIAAPVLLLLEQRVGLPATASEGTPSRPAGRSGKSGKQPKKGRARKARAASAGDAR